MFPRTEKGLSRPGPKWSGGFGMLCAAVALLVLSVAPAVAGSGAPAEPRVTITFQGASLQHAVEKLFALAPGEAGVIVLPDAAANPVEVSLSDVPWRAALDQVLRAAGAAARREGGVYVIDLARRVGPPEAVAEVERDGDRLRVRLERFPLKRLPALLGRHLGGRELSPVPETLADRIVTAAAGPAAARDVLRDLAAQAGATLEEPAEGALALAPAPPTVRVQEGSGGALDVELSGAPLRAALEAVLPRGTTLSVRPDIPDLPVTMRARADRETVLRLLALYARGRVPGLAARGEPGKYELYLAAGEAGRKVSAEMLEVPLRQSLRLLFTGTETQYLVEPTVPDVPITLQLKDVELVQALRLVVRMAAAGHPGITLRRDGAVWVIGMRQPGAVAFGQ